MVRSAHLGAFCFLALCGPAIGGARGATISGRVTLDNGQGFAGVSVVAVYGGSLDGGVPTGTATTDANGNYTIDGLIADTYAVSPSHAGQIFWAGSGQFLLPPPWTVQVSEGGVTFNITAIINPVSIVAPSALPEGTVGVNYGQSVTATGGIDPYTWSIGEDAASLPSGLTLTTNGLLGGVPGQDGIGTRDITFVVTDAIGATASETLSLTIAPATLTITTASPLPEGTIVPGYSTYSTRFAAAGGITPYAWSLISGHLPDGLALGAGGDLTGLPAVTGSYAFLIGVTDSQGATSSKQFVLDIRNYIPLLIMTSSPLPNGTTGTAYSLTFTAVGGLEPYLWGSGAGQLPDGLRLDVLTGRLFGTPTTPINYTFTVVVFDANGVQDSQDFTISMDRGMRIKTGPVLPNGLYDTAYSQTFQINGGQAPYTWSVTRGNLIPGLSLSAAGVLSGVPTSYGLAGFVIVVTDTNGIRDFNVFRHFVNRRADLRFSASGALADGTTGTPYSDTLGVDGGQYPYSFSKTGGTLPSGLSLSPQGSDSYPYGGVISGTPTWPFTPGMPFDIQMTDANNTSVTRDFRIDIARGMTITTDRTLANGTRGAAYSQTLAINGGRAPYQWSAGSAIPGTDVTGLPAGLSLNENTGVISGTPTTAGNYWFAVVVSDSRVPPVWDYKGFAITVR